MVLRSRSCTRLGAALAIAVMVGALGGAAAPPVFHLHLVKSAPAADATVDAPPEAIRLWFSQQPELAVTSVRVTGPRPATATIPLAPLARGDSASVVVAPVKRKMAPGSYTVAWRTMAKDGHVARGTFAFTVARGR
jgi:methionine-rich copper-binding protein CopC